MGALAIEHELVWAMRLSSHGYTVFELVETDDVDAYGELWGNRRWGWVVNAAAYGWTAHVGSWGQAADKGLPEPPVDQEVKQYPDLASAKSWVEQAIADQWREKYGSSGEQP